MTRYGFAHCHVALPTVHDRATWLATALLFASVAVLAQQTSGTITGTVQDSQGAVIPNATVVLTNMVQKAVAMRLTTNDNGLFVGFPLQPSTYELSIEAPGFKKYVQSSIVLDADQKIGLPPIQLQIGAAQESVTVESTAAQVETVTAQRTGVLTGGQMVDLALNGRNFTSLLRIVPGTNADGTNNMNGSRSDQASYSTDGVTTEDTGCGCTGGLRINPDAIAQFAVTGNGQSAEFGRSGGVNIMVVTKSGGTDFHGTGYWFHRNEGLNANTFTNNASTPYIQRQVYRFLTAGFNFSGPIPLPKINPHRDKLFFFIAEDWNRSLTPGALQQLTVPTAAQEAGNFSATQNGTGALVTITDPLNGSLPFPGNQIPASRFNSSGLALLKLFPAPNTTGQNGYNYQSQFASSVPQFDSIYRVDYNVTNNHHVFFRVNRNHQVSTAPYGGISSGNTLGLTPTVSTQGELSLVGNLVSVFSPTLTNEFSIGRSYNFLPTAAFDSSSPYYRSVSGVTFPLPFPGADPSGLIPNMSFGVPGGVPIAGFAGGNPYANKNPFVDFTDNLSKVSGTHSLKAGLFIERNTKIQNIYADPNSTIDFSNDPNNPGNTGWGYSNALLGNFATLAQASAARVNQYRAYNYEFYVQDSWKVRPNLTVNYGLRLSWLPSTFELGNNIASFVPGLYKVAQSVALYRPGCLGAAPCTGANRVAINPITGASLPASFIGAEVPGVGNQFNGLVQAGVNGEPVGLTNNRGAQWGPRLGVAWSPFGAAVKTVVRFGGGVFYERLGNDVTNHQATNPPVLLEDTFSYGNLNNYLSSGGVQTALNVGGKSLDGHVPTVYNFNFGIQHELPFALLLDVSYVGTIGRHLAEDVPFNDSPFGSAWLPQNQDPTVVPKFNGTTTIAPNLYRPYPGYGGIVNNLNYSQGYLYGAGSTSSYNGLQVSLNHRFKNNLQFGLAYTFSKSLGEQSSSVITGASNPLDPRHASYGPLSYDRPQNLVVNYVYEIPGLNKKVGMLNNAGGKLALEGWQISGITSVSSGAPLTLTYSLVGPNISGVALNQFVTGSSDVAPRVSYSCNPNSVSNRSIYQFIDPTCLHPAPIGSTGRDSGINSVRGPGLQNWDMSLFKKIYYWNEHPDKFIQLRLEAFNAFNHTEWNTFNSAVQFNAAGQIANLPTASGGTGGRYGFGALNTVRANSQRIVQIAVKLYF